MIEKNRENKKGFVDMNPFMFIIQTIAIAFLPQLILGFVLGLIPSTRVQNFFLYGTPAMIINLYITGVSILFMYIFAKKKGFSKKDLGLKVDTTLYLKGAIIGGGMLSLAVILDFVLGGLKIWINISNISLGIFILFIGGWLLQGFQEEFLTRSILMTYFREKYDIKMAILINSIIFSLLHLGNTSFGIIPLINIFLIGLVFSLLVLVSDSILVAGAAHSFWNMFQANIFGIAVSGNEKNMNTIFMSEPVGNKLISGGGFGIEGSIIVTILEIIAIVVLYKKLIKRLKLA